MSSVVFDSRALGPAVADHDCVCVDGHAFCPWAVDFSVVNRRDQAEVTADDLNAAEESCVFCSKAGNYAIDLFGTYLSFRYDLN